MVLESTSIRRTILNNKNQSNKRIYLKLNHRAHTPPMYAAESFLAEFFIFRGQCSVEVSLSSYSSKGGRWRTEDPFFPDGKRGSKRGSMPSTSTHNVVNDHLGRGYEACLLFYISIAYQTSYSSLSIFWRKFFISQIEEKWIKFCCCAFKRKINFQIWKYLIYWKSWDH